MKIGIITFHNTSNYGAALQAYATVTALRQKGYDAEIINYSNKTRTEKYSALKRVKNALKSKEPIQLLKAIASTPGILIRNRSFKSFYLEHLPISGTHLTTTEELAKHSIKYNYVICGSDQIWSCKNNGADLSYLLDFYHNGNQKISYASSFGMTNIEASLRPRYKLLLNDIKSLSVREKAGSNLIRELTGRDARVVVDPTLLISKTHWKKLSKGIQVHNKLFDFYYINNKDFLDYKIKYGKHKRLDTISMGSFSLSKILDNSFYIKNGTGPLELISAIQNCRCVFTSSYHAVIFSIIFEKPFYVFLSGNEGRDSRLLHILDHYGLTDRIVSNFTKEIELTLEMNYNNIRTLLWKEVSKSHEFLDAALSS